jgi:parallel beta-helix repeat protein
MKSSCARYFQKVFHTSLLILLLLAFRFDMAAQTFTGSVINTAGNSLIPSAGSGGCPVEPQVSGGTNFPLTVSCVGNLGGGVTVSAVSLSLTHTWVSDVELYLVSPEGQVLELSSGNGGQGDHYLNTVFTDTASVLVSAGSAPFSGYFRPEGRQNQALCFPADTLPAGTFNFANTFSSGSADGTWYLRIFDNTGGDAGQLLEWSVTFAGSGVQGCEFGGGGGLPPLQLVCVAGLCESEPVPVPSISGNCTGVLISYKINSGAFVTLPSGAVNIPGQAAGTHTITWKSVNACGVTSTATQALTVLDQTPPVFTCPSDTTLSADPGTCSQTFIYTISAADNCPLGLQYATLNTLASGGNGGSVGGVVFFDLNNQSGDSITVSAFGMNISAATMVEVYVRSGTYVGFTSGATGWVLAGTADATAGPFSGTFPGNGTLTPAYTSITIPPGLSGIALRTLTASNNYTNGNGSNQFYTDGMVSLSLGAVANSLWTSIFSPRVFNGYVTYGVPINSTIPEQTSGLPSGASFPAGITANCFEVTDLAGNTASCCFNVTVLLPTQQNDAGVAALNTQELSCSGTHEVIATIENTGQNTISSVTVNWEYNGILQPSVQHNLPLAGCGSGNNQAVVSLGSRTFAPGSSNTLRVWTSNPNGMADPVASNDTLAASFNTQYQGTYTIGGSNPDFPDFTSAIYALTEKGVCGPVTMNVRNGTYNEQISIGQIPGSSAVNTVTIQSESGDSSLVTLAYNSTLSGANYTLFINGADWLRIRKMTIAATGSTYSRAIDMGYGANNNILENNKLSSPPTTSTSWDRAVFLSGGLQDNSNMIRNNLFQGGSYGLYFSAQGAGTQLETGNVVEGNTFENQYYVGAYLRYQNACIFRNNIISSSTAYSSFLGLNIEYCYNGTVITGNKIYQLSSGATGIYLNDVDGTESNRCLVANNFVLLGGSSGTLYGIFTTSSVYQSILFNTVRITGSQATNGAMFVTAASNLLVQNNIFANSGGGYSVFGQNLVQSFNHNDLYTTGPVLVNWAGVNYANLADWQAASGVDVSSVAVDPFFTQAGSFRVNAIELNGAALPFGGVTTDLEGQTRSASQPDIGADEFEPHPDDARLVAFTSPNTPLLPGPSDVEVILMNNGADTLYSSIIQWEVNASPQTAYTWTGSLGSGARDTVVIGSVNLSGTPLDLTAYSQLPNGVSDFYPVNDTIRANSLAAALSGTYTIGGVNPDFQTFTLAVTALHQRGVAGPVVFNVRNGIYTEQIVLNQIIGADSLNTVTFQSESGDSSAVTLAFSAGSVNNYTWRFNGADWVTLRKMTLQATNSSNARVVEFINGARHNSLLNNQLQSIISSSSSTARAIVYSTAVGLNSHNSFTNNRFQGGAYAFYYLGNSNNGAYTPGLLVEDNYLEQQAFWSLHFATLQQPVVRGNTVTTNTNISGYAGIYLYNCIGGGEISGNHVEAVNAGGYGLRLHTMTGSAASPLLAANNFIRLGGSTNTVWGGISMEYASFADIVHNTVHITNTFLPGKAFYNNSSTNLRLLNNILRHSGGGYAVETSHFLQQSDFNNLSTTGNELVRLGSVSYGNLAEWQGFSTQDSNSVSVDPAFLPAESFRATAVELDGVATPFPQVATDIEGQARNTSSPDMGAYEFTAGVRDISLAAILSPVVPFSVGAQPFTLSVKNNGTDTLTDFNLNWEINGIAQTPFSWVGALPSGGTAAVTPGIFNVTAGISYQFRAWSSQPNGQTDDKPANDTIASGILVPSMSGIYTIGGANPDFINFSAAVSALHTFGVAGPVTFNVRNGTYSEQVSINPVVGADSSRTITFQSESGDSSLAVLTFGSSLSSANYTLFLNGADWIRFRKLTLRATGSSFGRVVVISGGALNNIFENNVLQGVASSSASLINRTVFYSDSGNDHQLVLRNNRFLQGTYGLFLSGTSFSAPEVGTLIENNVFQNQYERAISVRYLDSPVIRGNQVTTSSNYSVFNGLVLYFCKGQHRTIGNRILLNSGTIGIAVDNCSATAAERGLVANNFIQAGGTQITNGIYSYYSTYQNYYYNNVHLNGTNTGSRAFHNIDGNNNQVRNNIFASSTGGYAYMNNSTTAITASDHNDLYTTGSFLGWWAGANQASLADWQAATSGDANSLSVDPLFVSDTDLHVKSVLLNGRGQPLPEVIDDIDSQPRDPLHPDIGADEFTTSQEDAGLVSIDWPAMPFGAGSQAVRVSLINYGVDTLESVNVHWTVNGQPQPPLSWTGSLNGGATLDSLVLGAFNFELDTMYAIRAWTAMPNGVPDTLNLNDTVTVTNLYAGLAGVYTLGGSNPDFMSFQDAVTAMIRGGVVGPVTFLVRDGIYNEQVSIPAIIGAGAEHTITFRSESGDSTAVTLEFASTLSTANYTLQLNGADWLRFRQLTLRASGSSYTRVIDISNGAANNIFEQNEIHGRNISTTSNQYALVYASGSSGHQNQFLRNRLHFGSVGLQYSGTSTAAGIGTIIQGNSFLNQYSRGISLAYQDACQVSDNLISTTKDNSSYSGIYLSDCDNASKVTGNYLTGIPDGNGIYWYYSSGTASQRNMVANNFISLGNNTGNDGFGIYVGTCSYIDIYHNSVLYRSTDDINTYGCFVTNSSEINISNNIFITDNKGKAIYKIGGSSILSDYNDLLTGTGAVLGIWDGTNAADLSAWQALSGQDAHSVSVDPGFVSTADLHVSEVDLNNAGTPLPSVTVDFDGEPRNATTPDIGADEFSPVVFDDISVAEVSAPSKNIPFPTGVQPVAVVLKNNGANVVTSATVQWRANGLPQAPFLWSGALMPGERDTVVLGSHNFTAGTGHSLTAFSQFPNGMSDNNSSNDTTKVTDLFSALSGVYTIGGSFPDFSGFTTAVNALNKGGVLAAVTFNVRNGTYDEQVIINQINGVGSASPIIFQSQSGDSSLVQLRNLNNSSPDYIIRLNGADHITLRKMSFQTSGCCIDAMIDLSNGANYNTVENCRFQAPENNYISAVQSGSASLDNNNTIQKNRFENGGRAIRFYGQSASLLEAGNYFLYNEIINPYYTGIELNAQSSPRVEGNNIVTASNYGSFLGIECAYCDNAIRLLANRVSAQSGSGIRLYYCDGTLSARGLTANNFVKVGGTITANGINVYVSNYQNIYYNSIHLTNTAIDSRALNVYSGSNLNFLNNIYANSGGGYAAYFNAASSVGTSNFNDYYTSGSFLGYWSGSKIASLSNWKSVTGKDGNSISANPLFYSEEDLHALQVALDSAATPVPSLTTDFDGQLRNPGFPDIGADEFNYVTDDVGIVALLSPTEDCNLSSTAQVKVRIQNYGGLPQTGFSLAYRLNYGTIVTENVGSLIVQPGATADFTFSTPTNLSAFLNHELELFTLLPGDLNHSNDTLEVYVQNFQTPGQVGNMLPANGSLNIDPPVNFSWLPTPGATRYDLYVWKATEPVPSAPVATDIAQITYAYNINNWVYGAAYSWKVTAKNPYCSTEGPVQTFTLRQLPDLVVQNVQPPNMPFSGQTIEVSWEVHNTGLGSTGMATWYDYIYLSTDNLFQPDFDTYLGGFANFTALTGTGSYSNMKNVMLPEGLQGTHYLFVVTDRNNNVIEGNNNNNVSAAASLVVSLTPPPDLQVTGFITPTNAFSGTPVNVSWTVSNQGTGDVPPGDYFYDYVYFSSQPVYSPATAQLAATYLSSPLAKGTSNQRTRQITIPNGIFGSHYIHVLTDRNNNVFEFAYENNNTGSSNPINIILTPPPNLKVTNVMTPDTTSNGQQITLQWTVANQGATSTGSGWTDRIYMSPTPVFNAGTAITLGNFNHGSPLGAGESLLRNGNVSIPFNAAGKRYIFVETDVNNHVFEYVNEGDNRSSKDSTFVRNTDLIVSQVSVADSLNSGSEVTISWMVQNAGLGSLGSISRTDAVYLSTSSTLSVAGAIELGSLSYNTSLPAGQSFSRQLTVALPNGISGIYYIHVLTDADNNVFENLNENNNSNKDATYIRLSPWPDLLVDTLTGLPDTALAGSVQNISFLVRNQGTAPVQSISGGWKDRIYISSSPVWNNANATLLKTVDVQQALATGTTYNISTSLNLPLLGSNVTAGVFYVYVFTDATDKIYEHTGEDDNILRSDPLYIVLPPPVDFEMLSAQSLSDSLNSGQQVNLQWSVKNIGNSTAVWNYPLWYDGFYLSVDTIYDEYDDIFVKDFTKNGPVNTNQSYSLSANVNIPNGISGPYYAFLVADHAERTNDDDFSNNVRLLNPVNVPGGPVTPINITLTPSPNLSVNAVIMPTSAVSGQPVPVIWTVTNTGPGITTGSWTDKIYLSTDFVISGNDLTIGSRNQTRTLATGQSYTDTLYAVIPITAVGNFVVIFKTDANNVLYEQGNNETDNVFFNYMTASLPLPSDLVAQDLSFPAMAMVGEPFSVAYTLKNQGANPATGMLKDIVYFSADSVFDAMDVPYLGPLDRSVNIAPGGLLTDTFTNTTPGVPLGNYFIIVQADALNNIYENSESNNVTISTSKVMVTVQELPLGVLKPDTLLNQVNLYYRVAIDSTQAGETMRISLDGKTPQGVNELYVSYNEMPTRSNHAFSFPNPFAPDQAITIPEIQAGQYYLLVYGTTNFPSAAGQQDIDLKAEIIPFQISDVDAEQGGNTGNVTVRIDGARFSPATEFRLFDAGLGTVVAHTVTFINSTRVFATFNLAGKALGVYDVVAINGVQSVVLPDGFTIVAGGAGTVTGVGSGSNSFYCEIVNIGTGSNLSKNIMHPASVRINRLVPISIQFGNSGNTDIPCPSRFLLSLRGAPLAFSADKLEEGLTELYIEFNETGGPPGLLRPGAASQITIYSYSSHPLEFLLTE